MMLKHWCLWKTARHLKSGFRVCDFTPRFACRKHVCSGLRYVVTSSFKGHWSILPSIFNALRVAGEKQSGMELVFHTFLNFPRLFAIKLTAQIKTKLKVSCIQGLTHWSVLKSSAPALLYQRGIGSSFCGEPTIIPHRKSSPRTQSSSSAAANCFLLYRSGITGSCGLQRTGTGEEHPLPSLRPPYTLCMCIFGVFNEVHL